MRKLDKGEKIYENFCSLFPKYRVATPRTNTLELFFELKKRKEEKLLLVELFKEFMSNFDCNDLKLENGNIYVKMDNWIKI
jgi:hypothetical protein